MNSLVIDMTHGGVKIAEKKKKKDETVNDTEQTVVNGDNQ